MSPVDKLRAASAYSHAAINRAWQASWSVGVDDVSEFIRSTEEAVRKAQALRLHIKARAALAADELPPHGAVGERDSQ